MIFAIVNIVITTTITRKRGMYYIWSNINDSKHDGNMISTRGRMFPTQFPILFPFILLNNFVYIYLQKLASTGWTQK